MVAQPVEQPPPEEAPVAATVDLLENDSVHSAVDEEDPFVPRTKMYMDRFHVIDSLPASRDPKKKTLLALIRRLIIQGTITFDLDDWNDMTTFLAVNRGIADLEDVLDHFHFNREWWYQRVRIYPPPPSEIAKKHSRC